MQNSTRPDKTATEPPVNILLVDDQPADLLALRVVLEDLGHNLVSAQSGEEALRRLQEADFAVVLLDVEMPVQDGPETARAIRSQPRCRHTPIIFITGYDASDFPPAQAYSFGAVDYLLKPVDPLVLRAKVEGFVRLWQVADQAKRQAEQLRLLVEGTKEYAIFLLSPTGHVTTWNAGGERIKGYRADEIVGQHFGRFCTPEDISAGKPHRALETAAATGKYEEEGWRVRKDGSLFWASVVITALRDETGTLRGFSKVTRDMTERKEADRKAIRLLQEEAARRGAEASAAEARQAQRDERRQREQLHVTLASIGDAVIVTDASGVVTFLNRVAATLTGWELQHAVGQPLETVFCIINEETRQPAENPVAKVIREGFVVGLANHTVLIARDGREFLIDDSAAPIRGDEGAISGVVLVFRDVTEARRALEAQLHLAAIVESSEDAIISKNLDGTIISWNEGAERLYGYTAAEVLGKHLSLLIPADHRDELPGIMERLNRGGRIHHFETVRVCKDGSRVDVSLTISPIKNVDGKIVGASSIARNVTASKQATSALAESEARKAAILATALDAIVTIDSDGGIVEFNPAAEGMFGYGRAQVLSRSMAELIIPPALRDRHYKGLQRYLATGDGPVLNKRIEMTALRADGTEFPVELAIAPIQTGDKLFFTAYLRDITDRRRRDQRRLARLAITQTLAEAATLREAAPRLLQAACEGLEWDMGALWNADQSANVLRCVEVWHRRAVDMPEFEAITRQRTFPPGIGLPGRVWTGGKPVWIPDVVQDTNFPRGPIAAKEGLHGAFGCPIVLGQEVFGVMEFFSREIREPDADILEMTATVGSQIGEFIERKRAEEALRASEQRFARFMQHFPGLAWIKDLQGCYIYANYAAEKAFHTSRHALYGKTDEAMFPAETAAQSRETDRQAVASRTSVQVIQTWQSAHGEPQQYIVNKFPIMGPDGEVALVGGMAMDITDRVRVEEALKEADRRKDEFLAMLAHELRNPLAPIRNALDIMKISGARREVVEEARQITERQVQQLVRLVDDLLDVSRIMRGRIELRKEQVELATVLARAIESAQPTIDAQGHELVTSMPSQPVRLHADPVRLAQVIANLLQNAAKFTTQASRILLSAEREADHVLIRVRDTGVGIAGELLPHIFDLFVQGDRSLERSQGGLGIGLTVVRRLVEMHGGTVSAQSEGLGKGSEFLVRLPVADSRATQDEAAQAPGHSLPEAPRRILVVDDNVDAAESTAMLLRIWGHEVRVAHSGPAALEAADEFRPEIVLLDIGLPLINGFEVARRLRQRQQFQETILVAITGYGQDEDRKRSKEFGFDHHLTKPADPAALRKVIADSN